MLNRTSSFFAGDVTERSQIVSKYLLNRDRVFAIRLLKDSLFLRIKDRVSGEL